MRANSRASLESGREAVVVSFDAMDSPGQQGLDLARQLFSLAGLFKTNDRLARSLTDPSRTAKEKTDLAGTVFDGYIGDLCMNIVRVLVSGQWARDQDLIDAVEDLGIESLLRSSDRAGQISVTCRELGELFQLLLDNRELRMSFSDLSSLSLENQKQLVHELFAERLNVWTTTLFIQLISSESGHQSLLERVRALAARSSDLMGTHMVFVTTAAPFNDSQRDRLVRILEEQLKENVNLMVTVDTSIIGGIFINTGSQSVDMSLLARFNALKRHSVH